MSLTEYAMSAKIDEVLALLSEVKSTVTNTNEKVSSYYEASKSYSEVLKEIKEVTESTNGKLNNNKPNAFIFSSGPGRNVNGGSINSSSFPPLTHRTPKRKREDSAETPMPKILFRNSTLTSGTATNADHGLGDKVAVTSNKSKRVSPYAHLTKAIYISRLQTSVTAELISGYIKAKIPELNENDISLHLLIKKDQPLDELTFISFRLSCTEEHYSKFKDSSFWPAHVMIGEFIERARRQANMDDIIPPQPKKNQAASPSGAKSVPTETNLSCANGANNTKDVNDDVQQMETVEENAK